MHNLDEYGITPEFRMHSLRMQPTFPNKKAIFFGKFEEESGKIGYVATRYTFPEVHQVIRFYCDEEDPTWDTWVCQENPEFKGIMFDLNIPRVVAENQLVNKLSEDEQDLEVLAVEGGPLFFKKDSKEGYEFTKSSLLHQAITAYEGIRSKSAKALLKVDYAAAREVILGLFYEYRQSLEEEDPNFEIKERKFKDAFRQYITVLLQEQN